MERHLTRARGHRARIMAFWLAAGLAGVAGADTLAAQSQRAGAPATRTVVRVRVVDSAGVPLPEAEVSIVRGLSQIVASGTTDRAGARTLVAALTAGEYHLVVRKIGYARVDRFFTPARDTIDFDVVSQRATQSLDAVRVVERGSPKQRAYFIDAEAIANSKRQLVDASDIITKLRPDMIFGIGGKRENCRPISFVWVNGTRIRLAPINPAIAMEKRMGREAARATPHLGVRGRAAIPYSVHAILASIKPEHVAEVRYQDCDDLSLQRANSESALFVTLKPGIGYEQGVGSYVAVESLAEAPTPAVAPSPNVAASALAAPAAPADALAPYRLRLVGVSDVDSGAPVEGADIVDVRTGTRMTTTSTGTAHLGFLPDGGGTVRVVRAGYQTLELEVKISPADTLPITLLMSRAK